MKGYLLTAVSFLLFLNLQANSYIRIAILDSGIDFRHSELSKKKYINYKEKAYNFIDDDDNGFIDDISGWNFAENNNILFNDYELPENYDDVVQGFWLIQKLDNGDQLSEDEIKFLKGISKELNKTGGIIHGTHVAGISTRDLAKSDAKLLAIKLGLGGDISFYTETIEPEKEPTPEEIDEEIKKSDEAMALEYKYISLYLQNAKVQVANCSWGVSEQDIYESLKAQYPNYSAFTIQYITKKIIESEKRALKDFFSDNRNIIFVLAAGNSGVDNDYVPHYPSALNLSNTISVAALDRNNLLADFSNYGKKSVHVATRGVSVVSTIPRNKRVPLSGTSQAAPDVARAAVQILNNNRDLYPDEIIMIINETTDVKQVLKDKIHSGGVLNPKRAALAAYYSKSYPVSTAIQIAYEKLPMEEDKPVNFINPLNIPSELKNLIRDYGIIKILPKIKF